MHRLAEKKGRVGRLLEKKPFPPSSRKCLKEKVEVLFNGSTVASDVTVGKNSKIGRNETVSASVSEGHEVGDVSESSCAIM